MKLSLILEARDRGSRAVKELTRSVGGLTRSAKQADGGLRGVDRSMARTERSADRLGRAAYRMGFALGSATRRGIVGLFALESRLRLTREQMGRLASMAGSFIGTGVAIGGAMIGAGITGALYKIVTAGLEFEKYRTQLTGLMGSVAAGNKAMDWVTDFARTTPYEIGEVMESFVALKAYGIDPTDGSLRMLGDTAAGMGKSLSQAVEMIADAQTGEFERLKEFGIKASVKSKQVTFNYIRDGKQMTKTAKANGQEITRALSEIFSDRFAGGMDRLSQTTAGKWSNMMDRITISAKRVWEGGLGASVNVQLDRLNAWVDKLEANGSLKNWADETGKSMGDFVAALGKADWQSIARDVGTLAAALRDLAKAVAFLSSEDSGPAAGLNAAGDAANNAGIATHDAWKWVMDHVKLMSGPADMPGGWPMTDAPPRYWDRKPPRSLAPARPSSPASPQRAPAPAVRGKISLHVTTDPGVGVRPTAIAASGVDLDVNTGRAMAGVA